MQLFKRHDIDLLYGTYETAAKERNIHYGTESNCYHYHGKRRRDES